MMDTTFTKSTGQVRSGVTKMNSNACCRFSPARPLPPRETRHTSARGRREPLPPSPPARIAGSPAQSRKDHLAPLSAERSPCRSPPAAAGAPAARESLQNNIIRSDVFKQPAFLMSLFSYEIRPFKFAKAGSEQTEAKFCLLRSSFSHRTAGRFHCHLLARTACHALREPPCTPQAPGPAAAQRNLPHYRYLQHGRLPPVRSTLRPRGRCLRTCLSQLFLCLSAACLGKHSVFGIKGCRKDVSKPSAKSSSHSDAPSGNAQEVVQNAGPTLSTTH